RRVPTRQLPDWLVKLAALADPAGRQIVPELGRRKNATAAKARELLGWSPRSREGALVASAGSLRDLGLLKHPDGRRSGSKHPSCSTVIPAQAGIQFFEASMR